MDKIPFEDGKKLKNAFVTIDGKEYEVTPAQYQGKTPVSASNLNKMQDNIEKSINGTIETVTNENGTAIKFSDGTMLAYGTKTMSVSYGTVNFPVAFVEKPRMLATLNATVSNDSIYIVSTNAIDKASANIFARKNDNTAVTTEINVTWQAVRKMEIKISKEA